MRLRYQALTMSVVVAVLVQSANEACLAQAERNASDEFAQWGVETLDLVKRDLWLADRGLYAEKANPEVDRPLEPAFMWGAGVQLSALAAAAHVNPSKYVSQLAAYADALDTYWVIHEGIGGYSVLPGQKQADRYYDDNVWIVLALIETMEATHDKKYLERAEAAMRFVLSGEDDALGGGIYWRERRRNSKNTCSNAPAIVAALRLYQKSSNAQHLASAERLYEWTCTNLQDKQDGLFRDNVRLSGRVDRRKYSYNSALMIRANCLLFEVKGESKYLAEAQRIARSAVDRWIVPETGAVKDGGRFAHLMLESLLSLARMDHDPIWLATVGNSLEFVHENVRDSAGRYAHSWEKSQTRPLKSFQLIDQASAARAYFAVANAMRENSEPNKAGAGTQSE